ncbi:MAG TPA: NUDIX domain-containing protein [Candidatus Saccharimonadales bacterium]
MKDSVLKFALPFVAGIIERDHGGERQLLIQERQDARNPVYQGTLEFTAGALDKLYENVYAALAREIKEETGLTLKRIVDDSQTKVVSLQGTDAAFGFRPFCCLQQLRGGAPWFGCVFRCEVEDGEPVAQAGETKNVHWVGRNVLKEMVAETPEKFFTLELPAWEYYFREER